MTPVRTLWYLLLPFRARYTVFHDFSMLGSKVSEQFGQNPHIDYRWENLKIKRKGSE